MIKLKTIMIVSILLAIERNCNISNFRGIGHCQKAKMDKEFMLQSIRSCKPSLDRSKHKGQSGRIGVVGGSLEYTGAPYFAGISALKVGADLVHVFCASNASTVIKSYSPELIVHPLLDKKNAVDIIKPWFNNLHVIIIGPGLGREPETFAVVSDLINLIKEKKIPLVIDADGLFLITQNPELIANFTSPVILTPNKVEFERLHSKMNSDEGLNQLGGKNTLIFKKGIIDETISVCPELVWENGSGGSGRRCGGQGDLLSGAIATLLTWTLQNKNNITMTSDCDKSMMAATISAYGASQLIRLCNEKAFKAKGRSMLASDMIEYIHASFEDLFGE